MLFDAWIKSATVGMNAKYLLIKGELITSDSPVENTEVTSMMARNRLIEI